MVVKQVVNFASINLVHRYSHGEVSLVVLPVVDTTLEQILHSVVLKALHRKCFAWACLPVCKNGDCSCVEDEVKDRLNSEAIKFFVWLFLVKRIIELEFLILDEFSNPVNLVLAIMNDDVGVGDWNDIDFAIGKFWLEDGALLNDNIDFELVRWEMLASRTR